MQHNVKEKNAVIDYLSDGKSWNSIGHSKYSISQKTIHIRFCSTDKLGTSHYKFNINPNTLSADYEVWICGSRETYYLLPIEILQEIYIDPDAYIDHHHPNIRIVSVKSDTHTATYARGGKKINLKKYLKTKV